MTTMSITPMHKVETVHSWKEIDRTWSETGSATIVEQCQHCGVERQVLRLGQKSGPSLEESVLTESSASWRNTFDRWEKIAEMMKGMFEQVVDDTTYDSIDDVMKEIERLCQGVVDGTNLPYWQLQLWLSRPKRYKVRNLLEFVQGPVCNRCDRMFGHTVQPTVDHINGDRSNAHPSNLQLLCKDCNGDKGKNPPNERDISPFTYEDASCEHRLTCIELHAFLSDCENAEEELA